MTEISTRNFYKLLFLAFFHASFIYAQDAPVQETTKPKSDFWTNVSFGGGIGIGFGDGYSNFSLAPSAIYKFNDQFAAGVGLNGNYSKRKDYFEATVFGASIMGLFKPIEVLLLSAEFEQNNVTFKDEIITDTTNYWYPALFLGGGYAIGNFGAIGARYDVLYNKRKSVYGTAFSPFIRVFF